MEYLSNDSNDTSLSDEMSSKWQISLENGRSAEGMQAADRPAGKMDVHPSGTGDDGRERTSANQTPGSRRPSAAAQRRYRVNNSPQKTTKNEEGAERQTHR